MLDGGWALGSPLGLGCGVVGIRSVLYSIRDLNTCFPVDSSLESLWERMARLEEVRGGKGISESSGLTLLLVPSFCSSFVGEGVLSQLPAPGAFCLTSPMVMDHHLKS